MILHRPLCLFGMCVRLRWAFVLAALWTAGMVVPANAVPLTIDRELCHAVEPSTDPGFSCGGQPTGYQQGVLLLRADLARIGAMPNGADLLIHMSRFDGLTVAFSYADGHVERQSVRRGNYGAHWRIGGQVVFEAPARPAPLTGVTLAFDHLASHKLLLIRILPNAAANWELAILALLAGGSLTLLMAGGIYNISLAVAVRRQFFVWHGIWAICVLIWGLFWSQSVLLAFPGLAGTVTNQICTFLSCFAICAATISAVTALRGVLPRAAWLGVITLGLSVAALGVPAALVLNSRIEILAALLNIAVLGDLLAVALAIAWAYRRGSGEARDLAQAWAVPMTMLAATTIFDFSDWPFGGGSYIAVLLASAFQTIWLSIAATRRLATMRVDLDAAHAARMALAELANRDPLTGLLNRRGFVERINQAFAGGNESSFGLLLLDVDQFKSINDQFGHEVGDAVLCRIADYFRRLERELVVSGRMGGEEFVLGISGLTAFSLGEFAERVRIGLAACDHGDAIMHRAVTVSIGVAQGTTSTPFQKLYAAADRALYDAKRSGRNKVVFPTGPDDQQRWEAFERDQLAFDWPAR